MILLLDIAQRVYWELLRLGLSAPKFPCLYVDTTIVVLTVVGIVGRVSRRPHYFSTFIVNTDHELFRVDLLGAISF